MRIAQRQVRSIGRGTVRKAGELGGHLVVVERIDCAVFLASKISEVEALSATAWTKPIAQTTERARRKLESYGTLSGIGRLVGPA